jgi:hypothetical protein
LPPSQDEFPPEGGKEVGFAAPGQSEGEHVDGAPDKAAVDERGQLPPYLQRQHRFIERAERFGLGQSGLGQKPRGAFLGALDVDGFALAEVAQDLAVAPAFLFRALHDLFVLPGHGAQAKGTQQHRHGIAVGTLGAHAAASSLLVFSAASGSGFPSGSPPVPSSSAS